MSSHWEMNDFMWIKDNGYLLITLAVYELDWFKRLTKSIWLKQAGVFHAHLSTPWQEVGCVVPGEKGTRCSTGSAGNPATGD